MARNKYPEITEERILDAAQRLFLEKGYDNTTIQDIVDALGDLTKGAVYHHFKSKEEIMDAVGDRMFRENNPFSAVMNRKDLNGLEKIREMIRVNQSDSARKEMNVQSLPILKNPRVLAGMIEANRKELTPYFERLLEEGNRDGSLHTEYVKELAELIPVLTSLWLAPTVFPATPEEMLHKFRFIREMLEKMGVPIINDEIMALAEAYFPAFGQKEE
ncbi:MAG TPA: TetR/AcrR family transcriptional regulator [Candidatus Pullilachnospira intestinigallinarum]|nr:TetR/AcrR family transcriptional regulator [Candidatus Pullilachnospira intestinigallinarum]